MLSKKLGVKISAENDADYNPVYIIGCENKESTISIFIESLIGRGILKQIPNTDGQSINDIIKRDGLENYLISLQKINPYI